MSELEHKPQYVIKRVKKIIHKGHGGSWKIAYADFVTAMMTFFLLMWLLSLLNKYQMQGISNYFKKPLSEAFTKQDQSPNKPVGLDPKTGSQLEPAAGQPIKPIPTSPFPGTQQNEMQMQSANPKQMTASANKAVELSELEQLKKKLEGDLQKRNLSEFKNNLNFKITANGLRIDLHDLEGKPMFSKGKVDFQKYAGKLFNWLGKELNKHPNRILIIGHTDSLPFQSDDYTNWDLSTDRANTARRLLENNFMDKNKVIRIIGVSDKSPLNSTNGASSVNRRIEIIVLTSEAAEKIN